MNTGTIAGNYTEFCLFLGILIKCITMILANICLFISPIKIQKNTKRVTHQNQIQGCSLMCFATSRFIYFVLFRWVILSMYFDTSRAEFSREEFYFFGREGHKILNLEFPILSTYVLWYQYDPYVFQTPVLVSTFRS